jgi:hypothetical protein
MEEPRRPIDVSPIKDADARHNYEVMLRFRDRLVSAGTVEGCYMSLFKSKIDVPPMFIDQLAHVILRNILEAARIRCGCAPRRSSGGNRRRPSRTGTRCSPTSRRSRCTPLGTSTAASAA